MSNIRVLCEERNPIKYALTVKNKPDHPLSQTGGDYRPWLFALGGAMLVGAGVVIFYRMLHMGFTKKQKTEVMRVLAAKVPKEVILSYFYTETSVMRMRELRGKYGQ